MVRSLALIAAVFGFAGTGCKSNAPVQDASSDAPQPLLIGPDATGKAPPPVELPTKEAARVCLRAAQEFERGFAKSGVDADLQNAIQLYEKARTSDPTTAKVASRRLAALYDKAGEFSKAATEYDALLKANPKDADLLNDIGYSAYMRGDWANAEGTLTKAVQFDANHKRAWTNLGLAQAQQGKLNDSFQSFCKAVRPADAHCNVAFVLAAQGKMEDAKAHYREALVLDPGMRVAQAGLGKLEKPQNTGVVVAAKKHNYDPAVAASQVPTFAELEARLKLDPTPATGITPAGEPKDLDQK